ncbi:unnamed protein product [Tilletia laevis]|uniref:Uncharacterized protein n=2 Tax=Tilletia TaxID=13289 RepID=A0A9N8LT43_9BASI|nr:unnamed protein product [Tilletia laevis]
MVKTMSHRAPALAGIFVTLTAAGLALLLSSPAHVLAAPTGDGTAPDQLAFQPGQPTPAAYLVPRAVYDRRQNTNTTSPSPSNSAAPFDPNGRPTTALSVFTFIIGSDYAARTDAPSGVSELQPRQQTTTVGGFTVTTSPSSGAGGGFGGGSNGFVNTTNVPAPFLAFAIAAIALFVLVVAFVLLRIFVRNRRLRRLGLLPGDITGSGRLLGSTREIEDNLVPPKLWEATIADLEQLQRLKAARGPQDEKFHDWDGIMPIAASLPTPLYTSLAPDGSKADNSSKGTTNPATTQANGETQFGHAHGTARGSLGRLLRRNRGNTTNPAFGTSAEPDTNNPSNAGAAINGTAGDDVAMSALNETPVPAAVNVTVLIAMPSPKTVVPSAKQLKPSLHPAHISTSKVDEVDEEYSIDDKGKTRREPSLRSVRTAASAKSFAEARREAFFKSEESAQDGAGLEMPLSDDRSEFGFDMDKDDEEEELPELMFGTASVPVYRDWSSSSSAVRPFAASPRFSVPPVPQDLLIPTRGDLLRLLATARQVKERKTLDVLAQQKAAAKKELGDGDGDDVGVDSADGVQATRGGDASLSGPAAGGHGGALAGGELDGRSSLTTMDADDREAGGARALTAEDSPAAQRVSLGTGRSQATGFTDALANMIVNEDRLGFDPQTGTPETGGDIDRKRGSWLLREGNGGYSSYGYRSNSQANLGEARSTHTEDALLRESGGGFASGPQSETTDHHLARATGSRRSSRFVSAEDLSGAVGEADEAASSRAEGSGAGAGRHPLM